MWVVLCKLGDRWVPVSVWENICNDKPKWGDQGQNDTNGEMINMGLMNLKSV